MTYRDAAKVRPGEILKVRDKALCVLGIIKDNDSNDIFFQCHDGNLYHHTALWRIPRLAPTRQGTMHEQRASMMADEDDADDHDEDDRYVVGDDWEEDGDYD